MSGIGVIVNPRSRRNQADPRAADRLARALGDHGVVRAARDKEELCRIADDFRKLKIDVLGISGGDGTNSVTITGFLEVYADEPLPPIAFLRGGTMNSVANAVGVPRGRPDGLLAGLIARYADRARRPLEAVDRHVLRMGDHYGFLFGTGVLHGFISEYNRRPKRDSIWAANVLFRGIGSALVGGETARRITARWHGKVTFADGASLPDRDYFGIGAGTVDQIGLGFRPFYRFNEEPGKFHLLGIHCSPLRFISRLPAIWQARPIGAQHTFDAIVPEAVVEERGGVVHYMCDGDIHEHRGPLELGAGPVVKIIVAHKPGIRPQDGGQ